MIINKSLHLLKPHFPTCSHPPPPQRFMFPYNRTLNLCGFLVISVRKKVQGSSPPGSAIVLLPFNFWNEQESPRSQCFHIVCSKWQRRKVYKGSKVHQISIVWRAQNKSSWCPVAGEINPLTACLFCSQGSAASCHLFKRQKPPPQPQQLSGEKLSFLISPLSSNASWSSSSVQGLI